MIKKNYTTTFSAYIKFRKKEYIEGVCHIRAIPSFIYIFRCSFLSDPSKYCDFDIRDCCKTHNLDLPSWPYNIARALLDLSKIGVFNDYDKFKTDFGFTINKNYFNEWEE